MHRSLFDDRPAEEEEAAPLQEETVAPPEGQQVAGRPDAGRRSAADDILDAVSGRRVVQKDLRLCPLCGSTTKVRANSVGIGTVVRRCKNAACRNEYPAHVQRMRIDIPPPPPNPLVNGGPYITGPNRSNTSLPLIEHDQPIHRRLSETIRRMNDVE